MCVLAAHHFAIATDAKLLAISCHESVHLSPRLRVSLRVIWLTMTNADAHTDQSDGQGCVGAGWLYSPNVWHYSPATDWESLCGEKDCEQRSMNVAHALNGYNLQSHIVP